MPDPTMRAPIGAGTAGVQLADALAAAASVTRLHDQGVTFPAVCLEVADRLLELDRGLREGRLELPDSWHPRRMRDDDDRRVLTIARRILDRPNTIADTATFDDVRALCTLAVAMLETRTVDEGGQQ